MSSIFENSSSPPPHRIGVVIVTYGAEDYVAGCLESLMTSGYEGLRVVVVDNASLDRTAEVVRDWATGRTPFTPLADWPLSRREPVPKPLDYAEIRNGDAGERAGDAEATVTLALMGRNRGFAAGVNTGLHILAADPSIDQFWVLNPDTVVEPQTLLLIHPLRIEAPSCASVSLYRRTLPTIPAAMHPSLLRDPG